MQNQILTAAMMMAALAAAPAALAETGGPGAVTVCVDALTHTSASAGAGYAVRLAAAIFGDAGVSVRWTYGRRCPADRAAIRISFESGRPDSFKPEAIAYAFLEGGHIEGSQIVVMTDRVKRFADKKVMGDGNDALACVMAHEVGHILEGIARHSKAGIMKAVFDDEDAYRIMRRTLQFDAYDVELMQNGIARRSGTPAARNVAPAAIH